MKFRVCFRSDWLFGMSVLLGQSYPMNVLIQSVMMILNISLFQKCVRYDEQEESIIFLYTR